LLTLGAAIANARPNIPAWQEGYEANLVGGNMAAMLSPAGRFGKFVTVVLSFTLLGNISATCYSVTLNFQILAPGFKKVPRYIFAIIVTVIIIPVGIRAAEDFFLSLENFITLIAYWSASFLGVVILEHVWFRKSDCSSYDIDIWDNAARLPPGIAAILACIVSFSLVVPSMAQVWYTGPIAEKTGDLGFEFAFILTAILYVPFRMVEKRIAGR
jgi:purine-cytosine permease-like protein